MAVARRLAGTAVAVATTAGAVSVARLLQGQATGVAGATGALQVARRLVGSVIAFATTAGAILVGIVTPPSIWQATVALTHSLQSSVDLPVDATVEEHVATDLRRTVKLTPRS